MPAGLVPALLVGLAGLTLGGAAARATGPTAWQMDFQQAATPVMEQIRAFNILLSSVIIAICVFVFALLGYIAFRFNAKRNPTPSKTAHNTVLEVIWSVVPVMILVVIAVPSFRLLYFTNLSQKADLTIKAIGHQWSWSYEYPDNGNFSFDSVIIPDNEIKPGQKRLLEADNRVILPVNTTVRVLVTADDVLHSWAVPAFGVKIDAVPGRLNETWVRVTKTGVYYGQCSELCGKGHGFMPITVEVVSKAAYAEWVKSAQKRFASTRSDGAPVQIAGTAGRK